MSDESAAPLPVAEDRPRRRLSSRFSAATKAAAAAVSRGGRRHTTLQKLSDASEDDDVSGCPVMPRAASTTSSSVGDSIGLRLRAAATSLRQSKMMLLAKKTSQVEAERRMSRRRRSSRMPPQAVAAPPKPMGYQKLRDAHAMPAPMEAQGRELTAALLGAAAKEHLCDVELRGKDGTAVRAPGFLLACHSEVLEGRLFPKDGAAPRPAGSAPLGEGAAFTRHVLSFDFAGQPALAAAVHFFATLGLPADVEERADAENLRALAQLHLLARQLKAPPLQNAAYRAARRLMNRAPPLVCAAFDESVALAAAAEVQDGGPFGCGGTDVPLHPPPNVPPRVDELLAYCWEYLREAPTGALCGPGAGVSHLGVAALGEILRDQEIDVDEFCMWTILNSWVARAPGTVEEKAAVAKSLVSHIKLVLIDPEKLKFAIKKCGFVNPEDVDEALKEIELMLENESPEDKERVIVSGAGDDRVNGLYVRTDDEIGLDADDVIFLKEGDDDNCFSSDFGLYCHSEKWNISNCANYFDVLYSCAVVRRKGHSLHKPPKWGWKCAEGPEKAPTCTWKPSKEDENIDTTKLGIVPALSELKNEKVKCRFQSAGHSLEKSLTLEQMMALPEDAEHEGNDQEYATLNRDLAAMMDMPVDEGHDDEEGGYNVNYMSATKFMDSAMLEICDPCELAKPIGEESSVLTKSDSSKGSSPH